MSQVSTPSFVLVKEKNVSAFQRRIAISVRQAHVCARDMCSRSRDLLLLRSPNAALSVSHGTH